MTLKTHYSDCYRGNNNMLTFHKCYRGNNIYANISHRRRRVRHRICYRPKHLLL